MRPVRRVVEKVIPLLNFDFGKSLTAIYINDAAIYMIDETISYDIFDIKKLQIQSCKSK